MSSEICPDNLLVIITRHFLTIPATGRKVHYRRCGSGPLLLMVHQSPRSSAEYSDLMQRWGEHFTCLAPDTPGFGQSDPLPETNGHEPEIDEFADALAEFAAALGVSRCAAYGFHSGGIILVTALKRHPELFSCLAVGGYAIWSEAEIALFGERYLPEWHPAPYGEHLTWLWNRMLEQSWFFPWFDLRDEARLSVAHADVTRVNQAVMEMLDAGNAYRVGYGAVLRAPRDIPPVDGDVPPCLITAYDGDPLQAHIDRLGDMPEGWRAEKVSTPADHQAASLSFLKEHAGEALCPDLAEDANEGWLALDRGLIHWRGQRGGRLVLHPPAAEMGEPQAGEIAIDLPGHGLSDGFDDMRSAVLATADALVSGSIDWSSLPPGDPAELYPDLTPDRYGTHLVKAWSAARAEALFEPWYAADKDHAIPLDPAAIGLAAIARRARARLRAGKSAARWHAILAEQTP
ncbi:alpha/beta fold hydrolase [Altererythrobacter arenosus]|uniref:Alpha/beta fold hydrolase n=1 Tax=Altererythrobacter arenosus TaxID=3032592 RepID=A0ABY8FNB6_9SPHN|nr:alpha/beta fold hydrolase [Altererythrobacter sp. CAU 1644]WFL76352.1 alpha/beta fold hydrolase [Altererythrobacter sp. CAU 1644]